MSSHQYRAMYLVTAHQWMWCQSSYNLPALWLMSSWFTACCPVLQCRHCMWTSCTLCFRCYFFPFESICFSKSNPPFPTGRTTVILCSREAVTCTHSPVMSPRSWTLTCTILTTAWESKAWTMASLCMALEWSNMRQCCHSSSRDYSMKCCHPSNIITLCHRQCLQAVTICHHQWW